MPSHRSGPLFVRLFAASLAAHFVSVSIVNDHFDRISRGQQILQFGAVPFRDFFDPGWFLTIYSSAAAQAVFGPRLLGEVVLSGLFAAAGIALAGVLVHAAGHSRRAAMVAAGLLVLAQPRAYDYDKVFFYAAGLFLCWSYAAAPTPRRAFLLGVVTAGAGLYRYDNGVYVAAAALVTLIATHWGEHRLLGRRVGVCTGAALLACAPAAIFVAAHGGIPDAIRQIVSYARAEHGRTALREWPRLSVDWQAPLLHIGQPPVEVRWQSTVDDRERATLRQRYRLLDERGSGERWWTYGVTSGTDIRALVGEPRIERLIGIDRHRLRVPWRSTVGVTRVLPGFVSRHNAEVVLYYLLMAGPVVALLGMLWRAAAGTPLARPAAASGLAAVTVCTLANVLVLRDPIRARYAAVAVPAVVLAGWMLAAAPNRPARMRRGLRTTVLLTGVGTVALAMAMLSPWAERLEPLVTFDEDESSVERLFHETRAYWGWLTAYFPHEAPLYAYLARCTAASDRVMVVDFQPQVPMLSGRGFAGGMLVFFDRHWTSPIDQDRIVRRLQQESVPIVISVIPDRLVRWPVVFDYVRREYDEAAQSAFGEPGRLFSVRVKRTLAPAASRDVQFNLPCFPG